MFPLIFGLVTGALTGLSSLISQTNQINQQRQQLAMQEAQARQQANLSRQQAAYEKQKGELEAANVERQKSKMTDEYKRMQARNMVRLASGNVDTASGSAVDIALGNADNYAADIGQNAYEKALALWQGNEAANRAEYQARVYDSNASYLSEMRGSVSGPNLLGIALSGISGGIGAYGLAGGNFANLFSSSAAAVPKSAALGEAFHKTVYQW